VSQQKKSRVFHAWLRLRIFLFTGEVFMTEQELYMKMYCHLFNKITDAFPYITNDKAYEILSQAQKDTEEMFVSYEG
jgi:hypothetical protein